MTDHVRRKVAEWPVIPLIQAETAETAVLTARALTRGGMPVVEVVQRTEASLDALSAIGEQLPELITGAGTVLSAAQAETCIDRGAKFIVSPGLDDGVVAACRQAGVEVFPGIMTPSELQHAHNLGLRVVKYFPASIAGGIAGIRALASVFRDVRFIPTGGVSADNLADFLAVESVLACGGSWLTPGKAIADGNFDEIAALASEALAIAARVRSAQAAQAGTRTDP